MLRLCSDSSRSYPGRPVRLAVSRKRICVLHGNMQDDRAGVSRGHSRCDAIPVNGMAGNKPGENESREVLPAEGPNTERGKDYQEFS